MYKYTGLLNESGRGEIYIYPKSTSCFVIPVFWGLFTVSFANDIMHIHAARDQLTAAAARGHQAPGNHGAGPCWPPARLRPHR